MKNRLISAFLVLSALIFAASCSVETPENASPTHETTDPVVETTEKPAETTDDPYKMFENSDFIEKEQPELDEATKRLITAYQKDRSEASFNDLRDAVIANYNAVIAKKEAKLEELKTETAGKPGGAAVVAEMQEIVDEMYATYWNRVNSTLLRFSDARLLSWRVADAENYEYIPVMGAGETIYVKRTPVTVREYSEFLVAAGRAPLEYADDEADFPVNFVSVADAEAYCLWLTEKDGENVYRLPTESEWELAAGHMPKDAEFNCGVTDGRVSVFAYEGVTRGAHGALDFWGNVWEWTSTETGGGSVIAKGGSFRSPRTDCRTEYKGEVRSAEGHFDDVGFRVIMVKGGAEPSAIPDLSSPEFTLY